MNKPRTPVIRPAIDEFEKSRAVRVPANEQLLSAAKAALLNRSMNTDSLGRLMARDPVIMLELCRLISSSAFARSDSLQLISAGQMIQLLGVQTTLSLLNELREQVFDARPEISSALESARYKCWLLSNVARIVGNAVDPQLGDQVAFMGLFLRFGDMLSIASLKDRFIRAAAEEAGRAKLAYRLAKEYNFDLERSGLRYLGLHGLPEKILVCLDRNSQPLSSELVIRKLALHCSSELFSAYEESKLDRYEPGRTLPAKSFFRPLQMSEPIYSRVFFEVSAMLEEAQEADREQKVESAAPIDEMPDDMEAPGVKPDPASLQESFLAPAVSPAASRPLPGSAVLPGTGTTADSGVPRTPPRPRDSRSLPPRPFPSPARWERIQKLRQRAQEAAQSRLREQSLRPVEDPVLRAARVSLGFLGHPDPFVVSTIRGIRNATSLFAPPRSHTLKTVVMRILGKITNDSDVYSRAIMKAARQYYPAVCGALDEEDLDCAVKALSPDEITTVIAVVYMASEISRHCANEEWAALLARLPVFTALGRFVGLKRPDTGPGTGMLLAAVRILSLGVLLYHDTSGFEDYQRYLAECGKAFDLGYERTKWEKDHMVVAGLVLQSLGFGADVCRLLPVFSARSRDENLKEIVTTVRMTEVLYETGVIFGDASLIEKIKMSAEETSKFQSEFEEYMKKSGESNWAKIGEQIE